ncbi:agmatine deiminase family protein [Tunicatimonas pelagia]|uniref:agmatine deiminase family protein n=1 Tax=Tunicatimonas pelagia TaxID=931531 RepID=UPI0026667F48|nr:agmatine deiminase family protein [Tunicatimonas pelagia]WKN41024.1 agmatine deiminase family protein [Tunicatimonas pelagia]
MSSKRSFPAEWYPQSGVQLTWPHVQTDWQSTLDQVIPCYQRIAYEISLRQKLLVACPNINVVKEHLIHCDPANVIYCEVPTNDTWARDHSGVTVLDNGQPVLLDFQFNGWGLKFPANLDNQITHQLYEQQVFSPTVKYEPRKNFVLEGGSLESDGEGALLTTEACLLSRNRNDHLTKEQIEEYLKETLGVQRILWLKNGYLVGDDTDSHVDTLARFCNSQTIAYVQCTDSDDEHYEALARMELELQQLRMQADEPYHLIPLPMAAAMYDEDDNRLPATYANFLIMNDVVLLPFYSLPQDEPAREVLQQAFPDRGIIGIPCEALVQQHGSLHCVTMQYPAEVIT